MSIKSVEAAKIAADEARAAAQKAKAAVRDAEREAKAAAKEAKRRKQKKARRKASSSSTVKYDETPSFACLYFSMLGLDFQLEMTSLDRMRLIIKHNDDIIADLKNISIEAAAQPLLIDFDKEE